MYVANTNIQSNASLIYQAGNTIELRNGFKTTLGADFTARVIENCNFLEGPYNSAKTNEDQYLNNSNINQFNLYPNPVEDVLYLKSDLKENVTIKIFNSLGEKIESFNIYNNSIDVSEFTSGQYSIILYNENKISSVQKFIKL